MEAPEEAVWQDQGCKPGDQKLDTDQGPHAASELAYLFAKKPGKRQEDTIERVEAITQRRLKEDSDKREKEWREVANGTVKHKEEKQRTVS